MVVYLVCGIPSSSGVPLLFMARFVVVVAEVGGGLRVAAARSQYYP